MKAEAAGVQKQTQLLKDRKRDGIKRAKERGVIFGNPINLPEAQKKGAQASRNAARARLQELAPIIASIRAEGISSGADIAQRLNQVGKRTSRGKEWAEANLRRVLRTIDGDKSARQKANAEYRKDPNFGKWG
jgi:hypothetical protein